MSYIDTIINNILEHKPGNRAVTMRAVRTAIVDQDKLYEAAEVILEEALYAVSQEMPVLTVCNNVNRRMYKLLGLDINLYPQGEQINSAMRMLNYLGDHVTGEKRETVRKDGNVMEMWITVARTNEFQDDADKIEIEKYDYDPTQGPRQWTGFEMQVSETRSFDLVKKARRYGMQHNYTTEIIPEVYSAINRQQEVTYGINDWMLDVAKTFTLFHPKIITDEERTEAVRAISYVKKKAKATNTIHFLEESEWYLNTHEVIKDWSHRFEFEECIKKADKWKGSDLNYLYTLDSRSRMYSTTAFLNPQGTDLAKALLLFKEPRKLDSRMLAIATANHGGQDKLSYDERVDWVHDNLEDILKIGENPHEMEAKLVEWDIHKESKSRWQFLACCQEWVNIFNFDGDPAEYKTTVACALDMTCSALQIATVITKDHNIAPYVNLVKQDKPGDVYKLCYEQMLPRMVSAEEINSNLTGKEKRITEITEGLQRVIDHKSGRKVAKRPQMVDGYSGTRYGMKQMTYSDRDTIGLGEERCPKTGKVLKPSITKADANVIGALIHNVTNDPSRGSTKLKNFLRDGVDYHEGGAMMTWRTLDNFLCFQVADRSKQGKAEGELGGKRITLTYYTFQNTPNMEKHKNLVCPNITHSIDGTIIRYVVNRMPLDAPLAMVHDALGTSTDYAHLLTPLVLEAFQKVGNREWYEDMIAEMVGVHRPLPPAGTLTDEQIKEANYAIC